MSVLLLDCHKKKASRVSSLNMAYVEDLDLAQAKKASENFKALKDCLVLKSKRRKQYSQSSKNTSHQKK